MYIYLFYVNYFSLFPFFSFSFIPFLANVYRAFKHAWIFIIIIIYVKNRTREFTATRFFFFFFPFFLSSIFFSFLFFFFRLGRTFLATNTRSISARYIARPYCATKNLSRNRFEIRDTNNVMDIGIILSAS